MWTRWQGPPGPRNQLMAGAIRQGVRQEHVIVHLGTQASCLKGIGAVDVHPLVDAHHEVLLVDGLPIPHPVAKVLEADARIPLEGKGAAAVGPAVVLLDQGVGQIEVVQRHERLYPMPKEAVYDLVIDGKARGVHRSVTRGHDARRYALSPSCVMSSMSSRQR